MKIIKPNLDELKSINKDLSKIPVFGISFFDKPGQNDQQLKPIIRQIDETCPCENVLKENDLILKVNKKKIKTIQDFTNAQKKLKPNDIVIIRFKRRNQELNRAIRLISVQDFKKPKQKHFVRLGIYFSEGTEAKIFAVEKKSVAKNKLKSGDIILEVNGKLINNQDEYYKIIKKVLWGQTIIFKILRKNKKINFKIKSNSFYQYKLNHLTFGIKTKLFKKKYLKVINTQSLYSEGNLLKKGDIIINLTTQVNGKQINKQFIDDDDLFRTIVENFEPTQRVTFNILRKKKELKVEIVFENFFDFLKKNEDLCRNSFLTKPQADFMLREYENGDYQGLSDELRAKIAEMDLQEETKVSDEESLFISSYVKKEKVSGKDSFVVYYDSFPSTYNFEEDTVYLKIYVFDVTDLDQKEYEDIYYETEDYEDNPRLENYIRDNCNVIKSNNFDWSEGSSVLVQTKLLNPYDDPPEKIAFPYSVMNFPKAGKRKLAFRSFICNKDLKFHETEGRPLNGSFVNYRPEHFKLDLYGNSFDEYGSYPEILGYDSTEIEAEYKQAGYLGVNRQKLDSLIIPLGYSIASINNDPLKSIELVKDNIAYKGDRTLEGGINQSLNLKMMYEKSQKDTIDPQIYLKEMKNLSKIDERYEVINLLLNIATHDNTLTSTENKFLDDVAKKLELNQSKYLEIKKIETASLKSVDFGDKADESIFGLSKDMDDKTKCRILRQEYSRWNSQTNNSNKDKRVRAKEMVNLIANLRKQYNC